MKLMGKRAGWVWLLPAVVLLVGCGGPSSGGQALVGVTVLDGLGNPPTPGRVVVIRDGRIAEVAAAEGWDPPRGTQVIDLTGRYLMPGLIDAHAHVTILPLADDGSVAGDVDRAASRRVLRTLLGFGITTVRNPAAPAAAGVALRESVATGEVLGPRIVTAGNPLNLSGASFGPFVATPDAASVRSEVRRQADLGVDLVKVYASLSPDLVGAAIEEAHARGRPVVGHLQQTTWTEAARLGIDAITHAAPWSAAYLPEAARGGYRGSLRDRIAWLERVDLEGPEIREMLELLAERKIPVDPTLIALHTKFFGDDPRHLENPELHLAPAAVRDAWARSTFVDDWTSEDFARARAAWPRVLELVRKLHEGGVRLAAGSDLPNPWVIPGVSLHQELRLLHDAGIPTLEVLKIATSNGAAALGLDAEIGSVEPGKRADLIVLVADPAASLINTRAISHVFLGGRFLDPAALLSADASGSLDKPGGGS